MGRKYEIVFISRLLRTISFVWAVVEDRNCGGVLKGPSRDKKSHDKPERVLTGIGDIHENTRQGRDANSILSSFFHYPGA